MPWVETPQVSSHYVVRPCQIQQLSVVPLIPGVGDGAKTSSVLFVTKTLELSRLDFLYAVSVQTPFCAGTKVPFRRENLGKVPLQV